MHWLPDRGDFPRAWSTRGKAQHTLKLTSPETHAQGLSTRATVDFVYITLVPLYLVVVCPFLSISEEASLLILVSTFLGYHSGICVPNQQSASSLGSTQLDSTSISDTSNLVFVL